MLVPLLPFLSWNPWPVLAEDAGVLHGGPAHQRVLPTFLLEILLFSLRGRTLHCLTMTALLLSLFFLLRVLLYVVPKKEERTKAQPRCSVETAMLEEHLL
jgi:hypothetical protein